MMTAQCGAKVKEAGTEREDRWHGKCCPTSLNKAHGSMEAS